MYLLKEQLQIKETCGPRKGTSTDLHINWNAHTPIEWRTGTLRNLVKRVKIVCSTTILLHQDIEHLKAVLPGKNEYPIKIQSNLSIADMIYRGLLVTADTF